MKVLIATSGGGHFAPALAVIEQMPKDWEIQVVGRKYTFEGDGGLSLEYHIAKEKNIPFVAVSTGRLERKFTKHTIPSLFKLPVGLKQAHAILLSFRPDVVVSFGGYLSLPFVFVSAAMHIPVIIHEQTLGAGLANRIAARFAKKICISWESSSAFFPKEKIVLTGNPLRVFKKTDRLEKLYPILAKDIPLVYITGGSGGSHAINLLIEGGLDILLKDSIVIHQTGDALEFGDFARLQKKQEALPESLKKRYIVVKHVDPSDVGEVLRRADVVVTRAGIGTISELLYFEKRAVLVPLPISGDEQQKNAQFFVSMGNGEILEQESTTSTLLADAIQRMISGRNKDTKSPNETRKMIKKDAAEHIIGIIKEYGS